MNLRPQRDAILQRMTDNADQLRRRLLNACGRLGIPVKFAREMRDGDTVYFGLAGVKGIAILDEDSPDWRSARTGNVVLSQTRTLVHELAHECLHFGVKGDQRVDLGFSKAQEEDEARAVADAVMDRYCLGYETQGMTPRVRAAVKRICDEVEIEQQRDAVEVLEKFSEVLS